MASFAMPKAFKSNPTKKEFAVIHFSKIPLVEVIAKTNIKPALKIKSRLR